VSRLSTVHVSRFGGHTRSSCLTLLIMIYGAVRLAPIICRATLMGMNGPKVHVFLLNSETTSSRCGTHQRPLPFRDIFRLSEKRADAQAVGQALKPKRPSKCRTTMPGLAYGRGPVLLENDCVFVYERNGIYQARIRTEDNRYLWRSLKTRNQSEAISLARRLFHSIEFRKQSGLPFGSRSVSRTIDEYVSLRELQHTQGHTSIYMVRQIRRVVKFWREYIGSLPIEAVGNKELSGFIEWRKAYYAKFETLPRNAKLNPADKTLQWEMTLFKSIVKWAHDQGYRGNQPLPTFTFTPKKIRVRPAFEVFEYRRLLRALIAWKRDSPNETWRHADYVLVLANSGMRVGEANNLKRRDLETFEDDRGRRNYRFKVKGKTGERDVILRASAAKSVDRLLTRRSGAKPDDWLFVMGDGNRVTTLIDQFDKVLELAGVVRNSYGAKYILYSLRHFYAVQSLRRRIGIFDVARNMGTSVQVIQSYYGRHATPRTLATQLGG
jgi:integrase